MFMPISFAYYLFFYKYLLYKTCLHCITIGNSIQYRICIK